MNIKNRITSLEKKTGTEGFCNCKGTLKTEIYTQDLTEDSADREKHLIGEPVPETCEMCRKLINKQASIIQLVDAESAISV